MSKYLVDNCLMTQVQIERLLAVPARDSQSSYRVFMGGSWRGKAADCRSAVRYWNFPSFRDNDFGFRVALSSPEIPK